MQVGRWPPPGVQAWNVASGEDVIARKKGDRGGSICPSRWLAGGDLWRELLFWTTCPRRHWSRWIFRWCMVLAHCQYTSVAQIDEHLLAAGALLHSTGPLGCSKKEWKSSDSLAWCANAVITICRSSRRLPLSVSSCSARELDSSPHVCEGSTQTAGRVTPPRHTEGWHPSRGGHNPVGRCHRLPLKPKSFPLWPLVIHEGHGLPATSVQALWTSFPGIAVGLGAYQVDMHSRG